MLLQEGTQRGDSSLKGLMTGTEAPLVKALGVVTRGNRAMIQLFLLFLYLLAFRFLAFSFLPLTDAS